MLDLDGVLLTGGLLGGEDEDELLGELVELADLRVRELGVSSLRLGMIG